jgi:hypothetical protein
LTILAVPRKGHDEHCGVILPQRCRRGQRCEPGGRDGRDGPRHSKRPAIIYQQEAQGAGLAITSAIDAYIATAKAAQGRDSGDSSGEQPKLSNGP